VEVVEHTVALVALAVEMMVDQEVMVLLQTDYRDQQILAVAVAAVLEMDQAQGLTQGELVVLELLL
jgi:hypothetical protein